MVCALLLVLTPATGFHIMPHRGIPRSTRSTQAALFETDMQRREPDIWLGRLADAHARADQERAMHVSADTASPKPLDRDDIENRVVPEDSLASQLSNAQLGRAGRRLRASF